MLNQCQGGSMLRYAAMCLLLAILAFVIGFLGDLIAGGAVYLAKILFFVFLVLFVLFFIIDIYKRKTGRK
jgi:uncharacterized membrane protein YtjA (UPF0391 family)